MSTAALEHETTTDTRTHHVYRMFNAAGVLLYVGISANFGERLKQHRADKAWWSEVEHWTVEDAPSRADALFLEAGAILSEHPLYNKDIPTWGRYDVLRSRATLPHGGISAEDRIRSMEVRLRKAEAAKREAGFNMLGITQERDEARRAARDAETKLEQSTSQLADAQANLNQLVGALHAANELNGKLLQEKDQRRVFVVEGPCVAHQAAAPAPNVEELPERQGILRRIRRSFSS